MSLAPKLDLISVEDYLAAELHSPVKHEYLGGVVYAIAGARNRHNRIAGNAFGSLWSRLRGQRCQPYNSDTKVRVRLPHHVRFYYPDASVVCRPNSDEQTYQDEPTVLIEVLSRTTRRVDEGEKREAYLAIPSLTLYLLVEQEVPAVVAWRRTEQGFVREVHQGLDALIPLGEAEAALPLAELYEGVEFGPEPEE